MDYAFSVWQDFLYQIDLNVNKQTTNASFHLLSQDVACQK